jgi:hypothetical protein
MRHLVKSFWFLVAAIFLIEAWLWDYAGGFLRWLVALLPLDAFKAALARWIDCLYAPVALILFIVPVIVLEPLKVVAIWLIGHRHVILGILTFGFAEVFTVGIIAFLFDAMRGKLLSMHWFLKLYEWVLWVRAWADEIVLPYKQKIHAAVAALRLWIREKIAAHGQSPFIRKLLALREYARRTRST